MMQAEDIIAELKQKGLMTFGTGQERKDRLKKHYGIIVDSQPVDVSEDLPPTDPIFNNKAAAAQKGKKSAVVDSIAMME